MQKIGVESAILYIASLAAFIFAAYAPNWSNIGLILSALFFVAATVMLAVKIKSRMATRVG